MILSVFLPAPLTVGGHILIPNGLLHTNLLAMASTLIAMASSDGLQPKSKPLGPSPEASPEGHAERRAERHFLKASNPFYRKYAFETSQLPKACA